MFGPDIDDALMTLMYHGKRVISSKIIEESIANRHVGIYTEALAAHSPCGVVCSNPAGMNKAETLSIGFIRY